MSAQNSVTAHIARPYANALFALAEETNALAEVESNLDALKGLIGESDDFANFLRSPLIANDVKQSAVEALLKKAGAPEMVANFLRAVARNGRLFALPAMIDAFKTLSANARGEVRAEVVSASPLNAEQRKALADTLKDKIGKTVTLETAVDPDLIGGLVVKVGSRMIDSSLRTKLTAMRIAMKEVG